MPGSIGRAKAEQMRTRSGSVKGSRNEFYRPECSRAASLEPSPVHPTALICFIFLCSNYTLIQDVTECKSQPQEQTLQSENVPLDRISHLSLGHA